jgi:hypothetical protein
VTTTVQARGRAAATAVVPLLSDVSPPVGESDRVDGSEQLNAVDDVHNILPKPADRARWISAEQVSAQKRNVESWFTMSDTGQGIQRRT